MELKDELNNYFDISFPSSIQEAFIKCVFQAYEDASDACKKFEKEEAHDLLGYLRWIELRSQLRGLGGRFREIDTSSQPSGSAPNYHIVIDGEKMILTVSSVQSPGALPRPASYRIEYAVKNQLDLFEEYSQNSKIFGLLIHGADPRNRTKPAFIQVGFPDPNYKSYIHKIDLFTKYNTLVKDLLGVSEAKEPFPIPNIFQKTAEE